MRNERKLIFFSALRLQMSQITLPRLTHELSLPAKLAAIGTNHKMQPNRQPLLEAELFIHAHGH